MSTQNLKQIVLIRIDLVFELLILSKKSNSTPHIQWRVHLL